jgi:hypothetical protein
MGKHFPFLEGFGVDLSLPRAHLSIPKSVPHFKKECGYIVKTTLLMVTTRGKKYLPASGKMVSK